MMYSFLESGDLPQISLNMLSDQLTLAGQGRSVCLVSDTRGTVAPTADQLARLLIADGWSVVLLDLSPFATHRTVTFSGDSEKGWPPGSYEVVRMNNYFEEDNWHVPMQALCTYHWLRQKPFQLIIFQHGFAAGRFCALARQQGLAFVFTPIIVWADAPYMYALERAELIPSSPRTDIEIDFFEQETVARADAIITTNSACLGWMKSIGWTLPFAPDACALFGDDDGAPSWGVWMVERVAKASAPIPVRLNNTPTFTVCIATHNQPHLLAEVLDSLVVQTHQDFEVVIVDANSTEKGVGLIQSKLVEFATPHKWRWERLTSPDINLAFNYAVKLASGSHVLVLDDHTVLMPDAIAILAKAASHNADVLISMPGIHQKIGALWASAFLPSREGLMNEKIALSSVTVGANLSLSMYFNTLGNGAALFKREIFLSLGGFANYDQAVSYRELLLRALVKQCDIQVVPEILALNRLSVSRRTPEDQYRDVQRLMKTLNESFPVNFQPYLLSNAFNNAYANNCEVGRFPAPRPSVQRRAAVPRAFCNHFVAPEVIHVVFALDDNYCNPTCSMLASLLSNTKERVQLHGIATLKPENESYLQSIAKHFGATIDFVPINNPIFDSLPNISIHSYQSKVTYCRMFLADYLPKVDRVILLDSDIIVRHDIKELWQTNIEDDVIGAVSDSFLYTQPDFYHRFVQAPEFRDILKGRYFNMGVLVVNLKKWRQVDVMDSAVQWLKYFQEKPSAFQIWDQSPMNLAVAGRWHTLHPTWNMHITVQKHLAHHYGLTSAALEDAINNPAIYHFLAGQKPWYPECTQHMHFTHEYRVYEKMVTSLKKS